MSMAETMLEHLTTVMTGTRKARERVPCDKAEMAPQ